MCHLLESVKVENGRWCHLPYHEQRMQRSQQELFGRVTISHISDQIRIPEYARQGVYKCRIIYQKAIERVEFVPYHLKTIRTLRRVHCDTIEYDYKYEDRRALNELFAQRDDCDDVLIIKKGLVTDTSYANIIFYDGQRWVTPDQPLLRGTQRQFLLDQGIVKEIAVDETTLAHFQQYKLVNAFRGWETPSHPIKTISE